MSNSLSPAVPIFPGIQFNSNFYTQNELPVNYEKVVESFVQYPATQGDVSMWSAYFSGNVVIDGDLSVNGTIYGSIGDEPVLVDTYISQVEDSIDISNNLVLSNVTNVIHTVTYDSINRASFMGARAVGAGFNGDCMSLLINGSTLYAGGDILTAGSAPVAGVAQWKNGIWSAVGENPPAAIPVTALFMLNNVLYLGSTASNGLGCVKYDGFDWITLPNLSVSGSNIDAFQYLNGFLYMGGSFTSPRNYILRYNLTTNVVDNTLTEFNQIVNCMTIANGNLVVGGSFTNTSPASTALNRIAMLMNDVWTPLGGGLNNTVSCMAYDATRNLLYVGGSFTSPFSRTAVWNFNTSQWNSMYDLSYATGLTGDCVGMCLDEANNKLYVTGNFTNIGTRIAVWDGTTSRWSSFGNIGLNFTGRVIVKDTSTSLNRFYIGGSFTTVIQTDPQTNQTVQQSARYIAQIGELKPDVNIIVNNQLVTSISEGETKSILITGGNGYLLETVPSSMNLE